MKQNTHPKMTQITATCSCGNVIVVPSTLTKNIGLDVCSKCHPFYTGQQKTQESGGQIDKYKQRFQSIKSRVKVSH